MSEQHKPGKLKVAEGTDRWSAVYDGYGSSATRGLAIEGGHIIALAVEHNANLFSDPDPMENARRLAACWNALDGISTSQIEAAARSGSIAYALHKVISQRDELLEALDGLLGPNALRSLCRQDGRDALGRVRGTWGEEAEEKARAAYSKHRQHVIAKVEGGGV